MRKCAILLFIASVLILPVAAETCQDFDDSMNLVTVDCQTGKRIITQEDLALLKKQKEEARQQRIKQAEVEQKKLEQAIEKRKRALAKQKAKQQAELNKQAAPKLVYIEGKAYYLTEQHSQKNSSGISAGNWMLSVYGGAGSYLQGNSKTKYTTVDVKNVVLASGGLSGLYFTSPYFGFGLGLEMDKAMKSGYHGTNYFGHASFYGESTSEVSLYKAMLLGRLNINPSHAGRLYVPFGLGYGYIQDRQTNEVYVYNNESHSVSNYTNNTKNTGSTLVYFVGLGLEFDLTHTVSLGIEGRYNRFEYAGEAFAYANGLIKVNVKF